MSQQFARKFITSTVDALQDPLKSVVAEICEDPNKDLKRVEERTKKKDFLREGLTANYPVFRVLVDKELTGDVPEDHNLVTAEILHAAKVEGGMSKRGKSPRQAEAAKRMSEMSVRKLRKKRQPRGGAIDGAGDANSPTNNVSLEQEAEEDYRLKQKLVEFEKANLNLANIREDRIFTYFDPPPVPHPYEIRTNHHRTSAAALYESRNERGQGVQNSR